MKKNIVILLLFLTPFFSNAQNQSLGIIDSVKLYLERSMSLIEENALNKDKVDWVDLRNEVYKKAANAKTYEDLLPVFPSIFEKINDHHGFLSYKGETYKWRGRKLVPQNEEIKKAKKSQAVFSQTIGSNIAYIRIPGNNDFRAAKMDSLTKDIKDAIAKVNNTHIKGWIIDLRINSSGNMYPMIAGLSDLIGKDERVGGFITSKGEPDGNWIINEGSFHVDSVRVSTVNYSGYPVKENVPIAVLIGGATASSGEMTAISIIGRENSILIGEDSAGYTTTNQGYELNEYSGLTLAVAYAVDRNGVPYPDKLTPQIEIIDGDNFDDLKQDKKIQAAMKWLSRKM